MGVVTKTQRAVPQKAYRSNEKPTILPVALATNVYNGTHIHEV